MNSNSNYSDKHDKDKCDKHHDRDCDRDRDRDRDRKCCPTIIRCTTNPNTFTFTAASNTTATQVASTNICTRHIKHPCAKIDFATNILANANATTTVSLQFQVFKAPCGNPSQTTAVGSPWIFTPGTSDNTRTSFSFTVCDCTPTCNCFNRCCCHNNDCFIYTVVATPTGLTGAETFVLTNSTISVIATCNSCDCFCNCNNSCC
ncbi:MAG: DUF4489 domain-containing protein [Clostridiales bacterium]|nr:DUF4489 domain-containing protein [Clostridiales bacterium]